MTTRILAVDTATEACSVALIDGGEVHQRFSLAPQRHAQMLLPEVEALLNHAGIALGDLTALAVSRGPGSFTGVRIGIAVVQGLALGAGLGVVPVSTLEAMARGAWQSSQKHRVLAVLDARMGEVYSGGYNFEQRGHCAVSSERVSAPEDAADPGSGPWYAVGPGVGVYHQRLSSSLDLDGADPEVWPEAAHVASIAVELLDTEGCVSAEKLAPVYLRNNVAKKRA